MDREKERFVELRRRRGDFMLLAMLVSHYSTAEFVKWRDKSHLRAYAAAITHEDSGRAARLMRLCLLLLCVHASLHLSVPLCGMCERANALRGQSDEKEQRR